MGKLSRKSKLGHYQSWLMRTPRGLACSRGSRLDFPPSPAPPLSQASVIAFAFLPPWKGKESRDKGQRVKGTSAFLLALQVMDFISYHFSYPVTQNVVSQSTP